MTTKTTLITAVLLAFSVACAKAAPPKSASSCTDEEPAQSAQREEVTIGMCR
jgi:hypothetical protein